MVVLKKLENVENASQNWFEEAKSHLNISNKWNEIARCYGLTQDPSNENYTNSGKLFTSKLYQFDNLPELLRNATEEEQEAFHSNKLYDFQIPNNIDDFNKLSNDTSRISSKVSGKRIFNIFERSSKNDDYKIESMRKRIKKLHINSNDEDGAYNNPNLHSEEQDKLELPDNI
ncbi:unnamed protein product [Rhizophagus irregularis]|nr:unnamed protein product [Rhizophagus irregularis]